MGETASAEGTEAGEGRTAEERVPGRAYSAGEEAAAAEACGAAKGGRDEEGKGGKVLPLVSYLGCVALI